MGDGSRSGFLGEWSIPACPGRLPRAVQQIPPVNLSYLQPDAFGCSHLKGGGMPYVNIRITREDATARQKAELIRGVTQLLADVLGKNPATTVVTIDEVETDNWGIAGESVTQIRSRK
jgi:4-oxalocrotonate tautomerase